MEPVWWDPNADGGLGRWVADPCQLISARAGLVWFTCRRLGHYAYRASDVNRARIHPRATTRPHHPLVYASSVVCALLLTASAAAYALCSPFIAVSRQVVQCTRSLGDKSHTEIA